MKQVSKPVRTILYILFAVGGILVVLALSMVFLDIEVAQIKPQSKAIAIEATEKVQVGTQSNDQFMANAGQMASQQSPGQTHRGR